MPAVNDVGKPCAGEPHARFDGRELETERPGHGHRGKHNRPGNRRKKGPEPYRQTTPPRQLPTLQPQCRQSRLGSFSHMSGGPSTARVSVRRRPA